MALSAACVRTGGIAALFRLARSVKSDATSSGSAEPRNVFWLSGTTHASAILRSGSEPGTSPPGFCDYELRPPALRWRFGHTHPAPFIRRSRCRRQRRCASRSRRRLRETVAGYRLRRRIREAVCGYSTIRGMIADIDCAHEPNPSIIPQELHGGCTGAAREPNVSSP